MTVAVFVVAVTFEFKLYLLIAVGANDTLFLIKSVEIHHKILMAIGALDFKEVHIVVKPIRNDKTMNYAGKIAEEEMFLLEYLKYRTNIGFIAKRF